MPALIFLFFLFIPSDAEPKTAPAVQPSLSVAEVEEPDEPAAMNLGQVRRIYVDVFTGGESAARLRELVIGSLHRSKLFIVTENEERADAVLKGAARDEAFTDRFHSSENANAHGQYGSSSGEGYGKLGSTRKALNVGSSIGESESVDIQERKHEATAAVRLVGPNGDVIWSTTQESLGAKFLSASEDVAERIAKQLAADYRREKAGPAAEPHVR